jgi:galactokinase
MSKFPSDALTGTEPVCRKYRIYDLGSTPGDREYVEARMCGIEAFRSRFHQIYGQEPQIYRAPGRVNLIGEHTDYNEGFVFPAAIDLFTSIAIAPREDVRVRLHSENFQKGAEFELSPEARSPSKEWNSYISGVALVLLQNGYALKGANLLVRGGVPIGAGLSSSAALEVAAGFAFLANSGLTVDCRQLAQLCQKAENDFVGTRCGIMDQLASACCTKDHALLLDCRSLEYSCDLQHHDPTRTRGKCI